MKKLMLFSMWLIASVAAVGVAWAGVSVVDNQVVDPPSAGEFASPASTSETVNTSAASDAGLSSTTLPTVSPSTSPSVGASSNTPSSDNPSSHASSTSRPTSQSTNSPTSTSSSTTSPSASSPSSSTTSVPPPAAATTKTFTLTGGTAAISFSSSGVEVLWATPNPGFDVRIEPESPGIKVEFRADHHRSRVDAWWSGGPQHSIREEPKD